jgi:hypothetical protein
MSDKATVAQQSGNVRIRIQTTARPTRWTIVWPFASLGAASRLAEDIVQSSDGQLRAVRIEHRNGGSWKPAWTWGPR